MTENNTHSTNSDIKLNNTDRTIAGTKTHGFVTAWLIFALLSNTIACLIYLLTAKKMLLILNTTLTVVVILIITSALNAAFAIMVLSRKKMGFYGLTITTAIAFFININIGISLAKSLIGLAGFAILCGILQIKKNGVSAWNNLK
jgi:hypothetical protein